MSWVRRIAEAVRVQPMHLTFTHSSLRAGDDPGRSPGRISRVRRSSRPRHTRHRPLRCDCGMPAITVISVRVGSDPQYSIRLPLCPACLKLEQELHQK